MTLPAGSGSVARWTGLISESVTQHYGASARSDSYGYDANGNVRSLRRISATGEEIIADRGTFSYAYDSAGNLTSDGRNHLEIQNNVLNLPMRVNQSGTMGGTGTSTMTYTYLGDGTRAVARAGANATSYAGKEEQDIAGMNLRLLDFGARYYDSFTCRWNAVDPLAHKYFGMSPYNYCGNDPVNKFDPDGRVSTPVFPYFIVNVPAAVESGALAASLTAVSTGATSALALVGTMFLCVSDTPIDQQASAETSLEEQPPILASKPYYPPSPGWVGGEGRKAGDKQGKAEASFNKALKDSGFDNNNNNDFNPKNDKGPGAKALIFIMQTFKSSC